MPSWIDRLALDARKLASVGIACVWILCPLAISLVAVALNPAPIEAQTGQRFSIQGSALYTNHRGDGFRTMTAGTGFELQGRYTPGALSIGSGVQYTRHGDSEAKADGHDAAINLLGLFVEPRYVIATSSDRAAPYLSGRLVVATFDVKVDFSDGETLAFTSNGLTANVGGGLLIRVANRVNLDVGATVGYASYQDTEGTVAGQPFNMEMGSGRSVVARIGLAVGLGR